LPRLLRVVVVNTPTVVDVSGSVVVVVGGGVVHDGTSSVNVWPPTVAKNPPLPASVQRTWYVARPLSLVACGSAV
jgi:hypothetical protein